VNVKFIIDIIIISFFHYSYLSILKLTLIMIILLLLLQILFKIYYNIFNYGIIFVVSRLHQLTYDYLLLFINRYLN